MKPAHTIARIAELAGVSTATVSKVFNGRSDVAADTRAAVEEIMLAHGYRPRTRFVTAPLLELVLHELAGPYAMEVIRGARRAADAHRMAVVVSELAGGHAFDGKWVENALLHRSRCVVAVLCGPTDEQRARLAGRAIPVVQVDPLTEPGPEIPTVRAANHEGGLAATRHLLELGHRRIAAITGPGGALSGRARLDGYRAALLAAGIAPDPALIREGDYQVEEGRRHTHRLLRLPDPPTAVFAGNDAQALGVYQAAYDLGLRVPDDLSVVGFDDLPPAVWVTPGLTTVRQPLADMAAEATLMAIGIARLEPPPHHRLVLPTSLVHRASTSHPPARHWHDGTRAARPADPPIPAHPSKEK
ncbi:LacI family DNA-binding transcriptional regulator [Saccharothrix sp. S26]|uniref:LacI family DNA-binding transcriptional regulator n=1 Tax=Saccharothrix sp. S26 TaxID=2907215 RepID=UPI001F1D13DA|nr:LacI family DNA-binding transcriptional regulator [Saccharothrix sp. S26]MCE6998697.1 LacI family DNA-binding transcriptional regulator [Saccharothrix sp. S26]